MHEELVSLMPDPEVTRRRFIVTSLAAAVAFLQSKGKFHFGLSPDCVLARLDGERDALQEGSSHIPSLHFLGKVFGTVQRRVDGSRR